MIIDEAKRRGILTLKLHFTLFYLNLFSTNWHELWANSPSDYSYRVFIMKGSYFNSMKLTSNKLRRKGEAGKLTKSVYCFDEIMGFHLSWLGDADQIVAKLQSYAHDISDHSGSIVDENGELCVEKIRMKIMKRESLFDGHKLEIRNVGEIRFLRAIEENIHSYKELLI